MASYPVVWTADGSRQKPVAGRLEVTDEGVVLHGGSRDDERRVEIPSHEILCARRAQESLGPLRAIALEAASTGTILIATIAGVGLRSEILEQLQRLVVA